MLRAARVLGFTALVVLALALALLTVAGALRADLLGDGLDAAAQFWGAFFFTGVVAVLCLVDLTAL
ncbi:MAG: hypothetical protein JOZ04_01205, partial [Acidimicrobiia bacterium]|nr:hypothetical protein [Acidimicrobiia bacterium]